MKLSKRQLKRIIREEYSKLKNQGLIRESVGSYGGDPIETIVMFVKELHSQGDNAFTVWSKIAQLDRKANKVSPKISKSGRVTITPTPIANVIEPNPEKHGYHQEIWKLHQRGQFRDYESAIKHRLKYFIDEQSLQSLADEISLEFEKMSVGIGQQL